MFLSYFQLWPSIYHSLQPTSYTHWAQHILISILFLDLTCLPAPSNSVTLVTLQSTTQAPAPRRLDLETSFEPHGSRHRLPSFHFLPLTGHYVGIFTPQLQVHGLLRPHLLWSPLPDFSFHWAWHRVGGSINMFVSWLIDWWIVFNLLTPYISYLTNISFVPSFLNYLSHLYHKKITKEEKQV